MIRVVNTFWVLLITVALAHAQTDSVKAFTLKQAQDYAIQNNYQSKYSNIDAEVSKNTVKVFTAIGYPFITATGGFQQYIDQPTSVVPSDAFGFPEWFTEWVNDISQSTSTYPNIPASSGAEFQELQFGSEYNGSGGISVSQLIFDGSYFIGLKAAKAYVEVTRQGITKTELEVKTLIAQSYHTTLVAKENVEILHQNKTNLEKTLNETKVMYEIGFVEKLDVDQLTLLVANMDNAHSNAEKQAAITLNLLKFHMGYNINQPIELSDNLETLLSNTETDALSYDFKLENHIDFKMAEMQETLMSLNLKVERSKHIPTLSGFFNQQQNAYRSKFDFFEGGKWYPTTLWGINLNIPLFSGFGQKSVIGSAKLELERAQIQKIQVSQSLLLQEQSARAEYATSFAQHNNQKESLKLAEKIRNTTAIKFSEGLASSMELTQSETQYFNAQANYIQSIFQLLNAKTKLDKAINKS